MTAHRSIEHIGDAKLQEAMNRVPSEHYVLWTGGTYHAQANSLRSQALGRITEIGEAISVRELLSRAARIDGEFGFDPDTVRSGLRLHQGAKPCVYWLLNKEPDGSFTAVTEIPHAHLVSDSINEGQQVLDTTGAPVVALEGGLTGFPGTKRNPPWSRDELILALDLYLRTRRRPPAKDGPEVTDLSEALNALGKALGLSHYEKFRNPNGVYMKLMNFRRLDPDYTGSGRKGLTRGGKGEEEVWNEFAHRPEELRHLAQTIRQALSAEQAAEDVAEHDEDQIVEAQEGRLFTRMHRNRERCRKLVNSKKAQALKQHGRLACEACSFDFEDSYGERGKGFIECHHTKPVSTLMPGETTHLDDLVLLCSNCHRMVHARSPWLTVDELRKLIDDVH